jgi:hypothetical protein
MQQLTRKRVLTVAVAAVILGAAVATAAVAEPPGSGSRPTDQASAAAKASAAAAAGAQPPGSGSQRTDQAARAAKLAAVAAEHRSGKDASLPPDDRRDSGAGNLLLDPDATRTVASRLHTSDAATHRAPLALVRLSEADGGIMPTSPRFIAVAHQLGVSPSALVGALGALKAGR